MVKDTGTGGAALTFPAGKAIEAGKAMLKIAIRINILLIFLDMNSPPGQ
jgi:hypothetical protein